MSVKNVVRVATNNNFNCTDAEFAQLDKFAVGNPDKLFFINCNVKTPLLFSILKHQYKAVLTVNPDIKVDMGLVKDAYHLACDGFCHPQATSKTVAFFRVKWIPDTTEILRTADILLQVAPVVITLQRFNSKDTLLKYADPKNYKYECSRYRPHGPALTELQKYVSAHAAAGLHICDRKGLGCLGCGLCATLNGAKRARIESLNLSTSGVCPYNCPDCYAKQMQKFVTACGNSPMQYDVIKRNKKQAGKTKHIQNARKGK